MFKAEMMPRAGWIVTYAFTARLSVNRLSFETTSIMERSRNRQRKRRKRVNDMRHECKITVIDKKCFADYQEKYLADPKSGPCPFFNVGDEFVLKRTPQQDDFYHLMNGKFCGEAWDAVSRYVYTALQGGSIMKGWTNDDRMMIACCNDGTRPVIFKIERIDIPENDEEAAWLAKQDFSTSADDAYTG